MIQFENVRPRVPPRPAIIGLAVLALAMVDAHPVAAQHFPDEEGLREIIATRVDEGRATGIVLGVLEADGTRRIVAYGEAGPGALPLGPKSVFEIGSITKAFTGVLLAEMAGRGEVRLEAPIQAYAHDGVTVPSRDGRDITFLDLATHRSALPRLPGNMRPADSSNPYADYTVEQLHEFVSGYTLPRDIGSQYEYSNLAGGLLGHLLATTGGMEYGDLMRERVLEPLGMSMTGITLTPEMEGWLAVGHAGGQPVANWDLPTLAGAGALRSNAEDMLTFLEANIGEPKNDLERAMRTSHQPLMEAGGANDVALHWHVLKLDDDRIVWHNGGTGGYRTFAGFDPVRDVGVVVLTNSIDGTDDMGFHLLNDRVPLSVPTEERTEIDVDREIMERYVGVYELTPQFRITVTLEDDGLHVQATDQPKFPIFPESETKFFLRVVDAQVTFVLEDGEVTSLILHQGGADQTARKVG